MRRFQFSLRTLLIVVTLLAIPLGWIGWQAKIVRERAEVLEWLKQQQAYIFEMEPHTSFTARTLANWKISIKNYQLVWYRNLLGDLFVSRVDYRIASDGDLERIKAAFPEAVVAENDGDTFEDYGGL